MIKIIAGTHRGRSIKTIPGLSVRPILARIKKSLFDILAPRIEMADFLDLFAGNGVVGIEALSRGAAFVVFADSARESVKIIGENLKNLGFEKRAAVCQCDVTQDLSIIKTFAKDGFDIIFLGPPYKDINRTPLALISVVLKNIRAADLLKAGGLVIAQHHKKEPIVHDGWELMREKVYGDSVLSFFVKPGDR